ncbi:formylglycine-generating enzyme family protein [Tautonia sociabilis]|uniref:Uncharacterized protein n=1 Tax=Tautonia sociabilis TaxID=2080755 RepID=A0A432MPP1_9BACT|nr:SUMF1/EgtB/PvdO family nonheme iron enzyme [Tautonia sociabilis]RUL89055.1 hypothetical protein TsocGM_04160 [Tautonia sociabilis]
MPDEAEYEFAATNGGTTAFPWGDSREELADGAWPFGPAGEPSFDRTATDPPVFGLYSNVAEWTGSRYLPYPGDPVFMPRENYIEPFVIRGAPGPVIDRKPPTPRVALQGPRYRAAARPEQTFPGLGFRCARSARPRFLDRLGRGTGPLPSRRLNRPPAEEAR